MKSIHQAVKRNFHIGKMIKTLIIILVGFNLFIGCEDRSYYENESCYNISFQVGLPLDVNGYYHLDINRDSWQTLHRVSAVITDQDNNFIENFWIGWESNLYWYLGDTLGYIVTQYLNDESYYVSVDTSYMIGFDGMEVPTSNVMSYSNGRGEVNNMIAPVRNMIGDTLNLKAIWFDGEVTIGIVLD